VCAEENEGKPGGKWGGVNERENEWTCT